MSKVAAFAAPRIVAFIIAGSRDVRKSKFTRLNNSDSTESHLLSDVLDKLDMLFNISNLSNNFFKDLWFRRVRRNGDVDHFQGQHPLIFVAQLVVVFQNQIDELHAVNASNDGVGV